MRDDEKKKALRQKRSVKNSLIKYKGEKKKKNSKKKLPDDHEREKKLVKNHRLFLVLCLLCPLK